MLPCVDLPELLLKINARTHFTAAFTHSSEQNPLVSDLNNQHIAMLMAEACNAGLEPFIRNDVTAQSEVPLANLWGDGEAASADGMRFVVLVHTVHAASNHSLTSVALIICITSPILCCYSIDKLVYSTIKLVLA